MNILKSIFSMSAKTGNSYLFVGTVDELQELTLNPPATNTTIILAGELVMLADTEVATPDNYSRQADRITKSIGDFAKRTIPFTLKVWVHKNVIDAQRELKRHRFCFAIDQYLNFGKAQKMNLRLVTGLSGGNGTIIHVFSFEQGNLTGTEEKILPSMQSTRFNADYMELLNTLSKGSQAIAIANPLPQPEHGSFSYVGDEIYDKIIQYPITDDTAAPSIFAIFAIPLAILMFSIAVFIGSIAIPFRDYKQATADFQKVAAQIPKTDLAFGFDQLKTMQQRRFYLTEERTQQQTVKFLRQATYAVSVERVVIKNIELRPSKVKPEEPDIAVTIKTRRFYNETPLEQAKPIIDHLSAKLGVNLRLAHTGYQEQKTAEGDFIQFNIEGNFKGK